MRALPRTPAAVMATAFRGAILAAILAPMFAVVLAGCTGDKQEAKTESAQSVQKDEAPADAAPPAPEAAETRYQSHHDPSAFYTVSDVPQRGSYVELNFSQLAPKQLDRVLHRLKTEHCTCGCPKDTIDECLINDPQCGTATSLAEQVIREEIVKKS